MTFFNRTHLNKTMLDLIPLAIFDAQAFFDWFINNASYIFVFRRYLQNMQDFLFRFRLK